MKSILALALGLLSSAAYANMDCTVTQDGKTIQTELVDVSYSGPIAGEPTAAFSILKQNDGTAYLGIITAISQDGVVMTTSGKAPTVLNLGYNGKVVTCSVQ